LCKFMHGNYLVNICSVILFCFYPYSFYGDNIGTTQNVLPLQIKCSNH
jgi:hypothetical protein